MSLIFNIYCDESCHLEHDRQPVMGFGAVICPVGNLPAINAALAALKQKHRARGELKWEKVSPSRRAFYEELIDWFFAEPNLRFRGWLVEHKSRLEHAFFNAGSHDDFYHKMYYYLLEPLVQWPPPADHVLSFGRRPQADEDAQEMGAATASFSRKQKTPAERESNSFHHGWMSCREHMPKRLPM